MTNDVSNGSEFFTYMPQEVVRSLVAHGASAREWAALTALMHHPPNGMGEIGVKGSYVMNSRNVAEYAGLSSPDAARVAIKGLKDKGIIEASRTVKRGTGYLTVYRLAADSRGLTDKPDDKQTASKRLEKTKQRESKTKGEVLGTDGTRIGIRTGTRIVSDTGAVSDTIHTPTVTQETTHKERQKVGRADPRVTFKPKYPYPKSADEVIAFARRMMDEPGWEALSYLLETEVPAEDFYRSNSTRGWTLPDGMHIVDWHVMLLKFAEKIERDAQFEDW